MTPRQVAQALQFTTPRPIYKLIKSGELPAARIGQRLLIEPADVQAMLDAARPKRKRARRGLRELERER